MFNFSSYVFYIHIVVASTFYERNRHFLTQLHIFCTNDSQFHANPSRGSTPTDGHLPLPKQEIKGTFELETLITQK